MYEQQRMIAGKCTYYCALHVLLAPHAATYILLPNVACRNGYVRTCMWFKATTSILRGPSWYLAHFKKKYQGDYKRGHHELSWRGFNLYHNNIHLLQ